VVGVAAAAGGECADWDADVGGLATGPARGRDVEGGAPVTPKETEALTRLRHYIRATSYPGCRLLSLGEGCTCPLCDVDRLEGALRARDAADAWHEGERRLR